MKIIKILLSVFLSTLLISPSYAAAPVIKFTAYPSSPQTVQVGGQTSFQYTVQNTIGAAQTIGDYSFTASNYYTVESIVSPDCGGSTTTAGSVPAYGTCTITVELQGNASGTVTNPKLTVLYGEGTPASSYNSLTINVVNAAPSATYSVTPLSLTKEQSVVKTGNTTTISYTIQNDPNSGGPLAVTAISATPNNPTAMTVTAMGSATGANPTNCGGTNPDGSGFSLPVGASCTYQVTVQGTAQGQGTVGLAVTATNATPDQPPPVQSSTIYVGAPKAVTYGIQATPQTAVIDPKSTDHAKAVVQYTIANDITSGGNLVASVGISSSSSSLSTAYDSSSTCSSTNINLAPGQQCIYAVAVTSSSQTKSSGTVTISLKTDAVATMDSNSTTSSTIYVASVSGGHVVYKIAPMPLSLKASSIQIGGTVPIQYTITNETDRSTSGTLQVSSATLTSSGGALSAVYDDSYSSSSTVCGSGSFSLLPGTSCIYPVMVTGERKGRGTVTLNLNLASGSKGQPTPNSNSISPAVYVDVTGVMFNIEKTSEPGSAEVGTPVNVYFKVTNLGIISGDSNIRIQGANLSFSAIESCVVNGSECIGSDTTFPSGSVSVVNDSTLGTPCSTNSSLAFGKSCIITVSGIPSKAAKSSGLGVNLVTKNGWYAGTNGPQVIEWVDFLIYPSKRVPPATWSLTSSPRLVSMKAGDTIGQNLTYVIQNTSTTKTPLLLQPSDFVVQVNPQGLVNANTANATLSCPIVNKTKGSGVMPGQSCTYSLPVTPGTTSGKGKLIVTISPRNGTSAASTVPVAILPASATKAAAVGFGQAPKPLFFKAGDTTSQNLVYQIQNTSTTGVLLLQSSDFSASVSPAGFASADTTQATLHCPNVNSPARTGGGVMPGGFCTYTLPVTPGTTQGSGSMTLTVAPKNASPTSAPAVSIGIGPLTKMATWEFEAAPRPISVQAGGSSKTLVFNIKNTSTTKTPLLLNSTSLSATSTLPSSSLTVGVPTLSATNCPLKSMTYQGKTVSGLAPTQSCEIDVSLTASSTATMAKGKVTLTVIPQNGQTPITGNTQQADVGISPSATVLTVPYQVHSQAVSPSSPRVGETVSATFEISNNSSTIPLEITELVPYTNNSAVFSDLTIQAASTGGCAMPSSRKSGNTSSFLSPKTGSCSVVVSGRANQQSTNVELGLTIGTRNGDWGGWATSTTYTNITINPVVRTATWSFGTAPTVTLTAGDSAPQSLVYTIQNNSTTKTPLFFNSASSFSFTTTLASGVATVGTSGTLDCPPMTKPIDSTNEEASNISGVLPGDSCTYSIPITAGSTAGSGDVTLTVTPVNGLPNNQQGTVTVNTSTTNNVALPLVFITQPAGLQVISSAATLDLIYQIRNPNSGQANVSGQFTLPQGKPGSGTWTKGNPSVQGMGCTSTIIPANTTCTYIFPVTPPAGFTQGDATGQQLKVSYSNSGSTQTGTLSSVSPIIRVLPVGAIITAANKVKEQKATKAGNAPPAALSPPGLAISEQPSTPIAFVGDELTLNYTLKNVASGDTTVYSLTFPGSRLLDAPIVDSTNTGCLPEGGGVIHAGASCTYTVRLKPASGDSTTVGQTSSKVGFTVPYATQGNATSSILSSAPLGVQILSSSNTPPALAFTSQPSQTLFKAAAGGSAVGTLTYTVQNLTNNIVTANLAFSDSSLYSKAPTITLVSAANGCSLANGAATIPASGQCSYSVALPSIIPLTGLTENQDVAGASTFLDSAKNQVLTITYATGVLISNPVTIQVTKMNGSPSSYSFAAPMPIIQKEIPINQMQSITFNIYTPSDTLNINNPASENQVTLSANGSSTLQVSDLVTAVTSTCVNISAGSSCFVTFSFAGLRQGVFDGVLNFSNVNLSAPIHFSAYTPSTIRSIEFSNNCQVPPSSGLSGKVWVGVQATQVNNLLGAQIADAYCRTGDDCPDGASCILSIYGGGGTQKSAKACFWNTPLLQDAPNTSGNYLPDYGLAPGASAYINLPYEQGQNPTLAGEIFNMKATGRTGCTSTSCATGSCFNGGPSRQDPSPILPTGYCVPGGGIENAAALAEMNFYLGNLGYAADAYDVSIINGINVPMSIQPTNETVDATNPYICGSPGLGTSVGTGDANTLGACSWKFNWEADQQTAGATSPIPAIYFTRVISPTSGVKSCTMNSDCSESTGQACGIDPSTLNGSTTALAPICGQFTGFITPDTVCGDAPNMAGYPFFCKATSPANKQSFASLLACNGPATCYGSGASSNCCGCQNWWQAPTNLSVPSSAVESCVGNNMDWQGTGFSAGTATNPGTGLQIMPILFAMKNACPSAYVFPYDDPSSTFNCGKNGISPHKEPNDTNYKITFCPNGQMLEPPNNVRANFSSKISNARASGNVPAGVGGGRISGALSEARTSGNLPAGADGGRVAGAISNAHPDVVLAPGSN